MKLPKTFQTHPAIAFADFGENQSSDYKFYIELKSGWKFTWSKYEGCSSGFFNRVSEFNLCEPEFIS